MSWLERRALVNILGGGNLKSGRRMGEVSVEDQLGWGMTGSSREAIDALA